LSRSTSVVVGYLHPGHVDGNFCASLTQMLLWEHSHQDRIVAVYGVPCGPEIGKGRNEIIWSFLDSGADWLLLVDSDECFAPDLADRLLEVADAQTRPFVSGLYFSGFPGGYVYPEAYMDDERHGQLCISEWEDGAVVEVDAVGAGCLLLHRTVLLRMYEHFQCWFAPEGASDDDFGFSRRARELGFPIVLHTGAVLGHVKRAILDKQDYDAFRARMTNGETMEDVAARSMERLRWPSRETSVGVALGMR